MIWYAYLILRRVVLFCSVLFCFVLFCSFSLCVDMYGGGETIEQVDSATSISWTWFKAPWPVASRDFSIIGRGVVLDNGGLFVFSKSITHPSIPVKSPHVRGTLMWSTLQVTPIPDKPGVSKVIYAVASDPNGSLPKSLLKQANIKQPLCIANVRELLAKKPQLVKQVQQRIQQKLQKNIAPSSSSSSSSSLRSTSASASSAAASPSPSSSSSSVSFAAPVICHDTTTNNAQYDKLLKEAYNDSLAAVSAGPSDDGWQFNSRLKDIDIYLKQVGSISYCKGIGEIPAPPDVIEAVFDDIDVKIKSQWDGNIHNIT
jgi:hypothetical protein